MPTSFDHPPLGNALARAGDTRRRRAGPHRHADVYRAERARLQQQRCHLLLPGADALRRARDRIHARDGRPRHHDGGVRHGAAARHDPELEGHGQQRHGAGGLQHGDVHPAGRRMSGRARGFCEVSRGMVLPRLFTRDQPVQRPGGSPRPTGRRTDLLRERDTGAVLRIHEPGREGPRHGGHGRLLRGRSWRRPARLSDRVDRGRDRLRRGPTGGSVHQDRRPRALWRAHRRRYLLEPLPVRPGHGRGQRSPLRPRRGWRIVSLRGRPDRQRGRRPRRHRDAEPQAVNRTLLLVAKVGVSLALLGYLLSTTDLSALHRRLRSGDTLLLAAAVALYTGIVALSTWRWRVLLQAQGYQAPLRHLSASTLVANFFNNFLPGNIGGDLVRVRDSSRLTGSTTASVAVIAIDRILGFGALYFLALVAFLAGPARLREMAGVVPALAF